MSSLAVVMTTASICLHVLMILHNSMPQSGAFCKVGIMLAFLLALVLEDVEKPYGGWRWFIAAQILD